jgi:beta-glucosidase-like glycosyl hydrolase
LRLYKGALDTYEKCNASRQQTEQTNRGRSERLAEEGMVLLKNNGVLPLEPGKIALFGNGARHTVIGGTGSGSVNVRDSINIEDGLRHAGFTILSSRWLDRYDRYCAEQKEAYAAPLRKAIQSGDGSAVMQLFTNPYREPAAIPIKTEDMDETDTETALYVISRVSGEGSDRSSGKGDYQLYDEELEAVRTLEGHYRHLVVILNTGGVMDLTPLERDARVDAILLMSQAGCNGGDALGRILSGAVTPSGHLTATWAGAYDKYPCADTFSHMNGNVDDEEYREGIYVGYRYFDTFKKDVLYPFGYGLSYTEFSFAAESVTLKDGVVSVNVRVKNEGSSFAGKAVVQVYVSAVSAAQTGSGKAETGGEKTDECKTADRLDRPYQELKGFAKTDVIEPGESEFVTVCISVRDLASYDQKMHAWILPAGSYLIRVGEHSRSTKAVAVLDVSEDEIIQKTCAILKDSWPLEELSPENCGAGLDELGEGNENIPHLVLDKEDAEQSMHSSSGSSGNTASDFRRDHAESACGLSDNFSKAQHCPNDAALTAADVLAGRASVQDLAAQLTIEEMATLCVGTMREGGDATSFIGQASNMTPGAAGDTSSILTKSRGIRNLVMADGPAGIRISKVYGTDQDGHVVPGVGSAAMPDLDFILQRDEAEAPEGVTLHYQFCTAIPIGTMLAQTWNMEILRDAGDLVGGEMEEFGIDLWLAPGMNIQRNPLCGRNFEYYSEDPFLTGVCAAAITEGVQSHPGKGTTIKHFAFNNQEDNRMHVNEHVSERAAREIYLRGFEITVRRAQPLALMTSYNLVAGTHMANRRDLLTDVLRKEWGFRGMIMTDWGTAGGIEMEPGKTFKYGTSDPAQCMHAGNDLIMPGKQADVDAIIDAVRSGSLDERELRACAVRILKTVLIADSGK